ncbi:MmcQ/YjbR family DNA-binding protein [Nocardioides donggukensis]|uniref:MmcQ/YjbR family DNA-binding protein n=1 Tax=Nocardioides donggukensis TaxID=2774019 RepID=A0A927PYU5_9ACTN|nr:MmcQ/YjbR family DNA-binding protein [Nocardioides donggukensis]MBD8868978.1 MmcQ/YjbR family DNA-binding protein [Nocardioides donggukensis]
MAHPQMFDERDPLLARLREIALALPGADELVTHGRPAFRCGKLFAVYGGGVKLAPGRHEPHPHSLLFKPDPAEAPAYDEDDRFFVPAYLGPHGWFGTDLDAPGTDWREVAEIVDASYRTIAPRRRLAELDARAE